MIVEDKDTVAHTDDIRVTVKPHCEILIVELLLRLLQDTILETRHLKLPCNTAEFLHTFIRTVTICLIVGCVVLTTNFTNCFVDFVLYTIGQPATEFIVRSKTLPAAALRVVVIEVQ